MIKDVHMNKGIDRNLLAHYLNKDTEEKTEE